jgi:hypothetical protein
MDDAVRDAIGKIIGFYEYEEWKDFDCRTSPRERAAHIYNSIRLVRKWYGPSGRRTGWGTAWDAPSKNADR